MGEKKSSGCGPGPKGQKVRKGGEKIPRALKNQENTRRSSKSFDKKQPGKKKGGEDRRKGFSFTLRGIKGKKGWGEESYCSPGDRENKGRKEK